jgi:protease-4
MKQFLKFTLATIVGLFLTIFIFIVIGAIAFSPKDKKVEVAENSIFKLELNGPIFDRAVDNPFANFDFMTGESISPIGLYDVLTSIREASENENINGIFLDLSFVQGGMATKREIRNALLDFKKSGKFIYAYADNYTQGTYYLASVADSVFINPLGVVEWKGLSSQVAFVVGFLEKIGVEPQVFRYGKFKGAVEPFLREDLSPENREQISVFMGSIWNTMVGEVSESRGIESEKLNMIADSLWAIQRGKALELGLVDGGMYRDEMDAFLMDKVGVEDRDDIEYATLSDMKSVVEDKESLSLDKVAVIYAQGEIVDVDGGEYTIAGTKFAKAVRKAREDENVKAIVLRINSPGGSGFASDLIWRELNLAKAEKPLIISQGDLAASGGYYLSAPGDTILCDPTTITGSIGVFGLLFNPNELLTEKLGLTFDTEKTNAHADFPDMTDSFDDFEANIIQNQVNEFYESFVDIVSEGRGMSFEDVDSIAQGRVWSGANAIENGLTDGYGGLLDAIEIAASKAGLEEYRLVELPEVKDPFQELLSEFGGAPADEQILAQWGIDGSYYRDMKIILNNNPIQARIPYMITVK